MKLFTVLLPGLILLPACWPQSQRKEGSTHTFFVQAPLDSPAITQLQQTLKPIVARIVEEEMGMPIDPGFPPFFFKKRQAVTLYYLEDLYDSNEPLAGLLYLFVEPAVTQIAQEKLAPQNATITSNLWFFGQEKSGLFGTTYLVTLIEDSNHELQELNTELKGAFHRASNEYKRAYKVNLYDQAKSDKLPYWPKSSVSYLPHITLGELRTNYIRHRVGEERAEKVIARIKERIMKTVQQFIIETDPEARNLSFNSLALYDPEKKKYIHKQAFKEADTKEAQAASHTTS